MSMDFKYLTYRIYLNLKDYTEINIWDPVCFSVSPDYKNVPIGKGESFPRILFSINYSRQYIETFKADELDDWYKVEKLIADFPDKYIKIKGPFNREYDARIHSGLSAVELINGDRGYQLIIELLAGNNIGRFDLDPKYEYPYVTVEDLNSRLNEPFDFNQLSDYTFLSSDKRKEVPLTELEAEGRKVMHELIQGIENDDEIQDELRSYAKEVLNIVKKYIEEYNKTETFDDLSLNELFEEAYKNA